MTHFLRTDPSVPAKQRETALSAGLEKGTFDDTNGYPHQLYVREARRMDLDYVATQKDVEGLTNPADSVGLASYGFDEWPYATVALDGKSRLWAHITPCSISRKKTVGSTVFLTVRSSPRWRSARISSCPCVAASHIAMTSIRMEVIWMVLG